MRIMSIRGKYLVWAITACCCQAFLLLGYDQGVMSGIIGAENQFGEDFGRPDPTTQGTIVAIYDIGCAIGSLTTFFWGESIGRKRMIMAGAFTMLLGTAILTSSTTLAQLYVGRIMTGIGNGFNSSSIPVYQSEMCGGMIRGALVCLNSTVTIIGLVIAYWLDYGMSFVGGPAQWRLPIGFQAFFALCLFLQVLVLPDSPRWCMAHGRGEEGARILAQLEDRDSPHHPDVVEKRKEIEVSLAQESAGGPFRYRELLEGGPLGNFRRICLCIGVNVMQQFTGYLAPIVYHNTMGLSRNLSLLLGGFTAVTYMLASFIPLWTVDRFGRRFLLMTSATGLSVCYILAATLLSRNTKGAAYGATAMMFLVQIFLGIGYLPIPWLYPAEITTTRIRARGSAISSFFNWMCVFAVVEMTPPAIANIGWRVFIIFAIFNALWVPLVYVFFPETKGLELEDVDHIFEKGGFTGGVWSSPGGRTVERRRIARGVEDREGGPEEKWKAQADVRIEDSSAVRAEAVKGEK
ncbi:general substrate transporter [Dichomitus squalens LYAD-421 SS1]|uniref:General substrate transporter n=1 Tax=Dichomitus squalens (strain LYAD-421) TaxID=732165 RepID=R7SKW7_DICSQ|nr:general substrate transporter [Dichomitus squalens LYAD-421 SS1]EJF56774.1 general substrate transporter [Dichomitus squalens LYAD-421 SS1]